MRRTFFRCAVSGLIVVLALAGAAPAAAIPIEDSWRGVWNWLANVWMADEAVEGDRGLELDPDGLTLGDRGLEADPNGLTVGSDRGPELDPDGLTVGERGPEADPNG